MTPEQEKQWREDFILKFNPEKLTNLDKIQLGHHWDGYLEACKKRQEENEKWKNIAEISDMKSLIAKELSDVIREVLCLDREDHFINPSTAKTLLECATGKIVKEDIQKRDKLIEQAKPWVKSISMFADQAKIKNNGDRARMMDLKTKIDQWEKEIEEILKC